MSLVFSLLLIPITLFVLLNLTRATDVLCPFSDACDCAKWMDEERIFDIVICQPLNNSLLPRFNAPQRKMYTIWRDMTVHTNVDNIPKDAFAIFNSINTLSLEHQGTGKEDIDWDPEAFNVVRVTSLKVNNFCIFPLPEATQKLNPRLTDLSMTKCPKQTVLNQTALAYLPNLRALSIDQSPVADIEDLDVLNNLENLVITKTGLSKIPNKWTNSLKTLDLSSNNISVIGKDAFYNLSNCVEIDLQNNPITQIDYSAFLALKSVNTLNLQNSKLESVDLKLFEQMDNLTRLTLDNSMSIKTLSASQADWIKLHSNARDRSSILISLNYTGLQTIDSNVDKLMDKYPLLTISIVGVNDFHCSPQIAWMAQRAFCDQTLIIDKAYCSQNENGSAVSYSLRDYLSVLEPDVCSRSFTTRKYDNSTSTSKTPTRTTPTPTPTPTPKGASKSVVFGYTTLLTSLTISLIASR